tara:strand:- start:10683 stop:12287 length:1605 start_codon:yes stop_codon:yes gene_type:complete
MKKHILYIFIFISYLGFAQQDISVLTAIDTTQIRIGEQFQYKITVGVKENVSFPELSDLGQLEVVSSRKVDTTQSGLIKKYLLTGFDSGSFYIPKQQIFIQDKAYFTDSLLVNVSTVAVDTLKQKLFGIKTIAEEPMVYDDYTPYFYWLYLFVGIILLLLSIYFFLRKKNKAARAEKEVIAPYQEAIQKFTQLDEKELWQNNQVKEYYVELTEIIRVYLGREVNVHTLEATTDEMIELLANQNKSKDIGISKESIQQIEAFLKHADFVKFAKLRPAEGEIRNDRNIAAYLVEGVQPILEKYNEEQREIQQALQKEQKSEKKFTLKKLSKRSIIFISIISVLLVMIAIFTYQIIQNSNAIKSSIIPSKANTEVVSDGWGSQSFGNPVLTLTAPFTLSLKSNSIPSQAASMISSLEVYGYEETEKDFTVSVTIVEYTSQVNPDLEQVLQGSLKSLELKYKMEDLEFERQPASFGEEVQGTYLVGKAAVGQTKKDFKILGFIKGNKIWQVLTIGNSDDNETQVMLETVVQSINIAKE